MAHADAPSASKSADAAWPTVSFTWTTLGSRILVGADPNAVVLPDGRVRLYWAGGVEGLTSAVSTDGVRFTKEPGQRLDPSVGGPHTRIVALPDGRWRLFFNVGRGDTVDRGIGSAVSTDGLDFAVEPGLRVSSVAAGLAPKELSPGDVVKLPDGRWRMYFSSISTTHRDPRTVHERARSAVSSDLLNWQVEPGDRIGGSSAVRGSGEHPAAIELADRSVALFYGRPSPFNLFVSVARDGATFKAEQPLMYGVLDSAIIRRPDGTHLLYYGTHDRRTNTSYVNVARLRFHRRPPARPCVVPDLPGKSLAKAKVLLTKATCTLGTIRRVHSNQLAAGWVISQNRLAGTILPRGSKVSLVVSLGRR